MKSQNNEQSLALDMNAGPQSVPPGTLDFHPIANIFPLLSGAEFDGLVDDIREHGLREAIWEYEGKILDGRNRYRACLAADVECGPMRPYRGDDPIGFVVSLNLNRRHLSTSQRAMVAARIATLRHGGDRKSQICDLKQADAAARLNVGKRSVESARGVLDEGAPELVMAVERGGLAISTAADVASLPKDEQRELVARGEREILLRAKEIRAARAEERRDERLQNLAEISMGNTPLLTSKKFPVIYADPPWRYENPPIGASSRSIENHYPTMTLEEICALPVSDLATDDAILYLWATAPKLAECIEVIKAWGFEYRTNMVWDKEIIGMGYHARNQHELLLIAKRGSIPPPAAGTQPSSLYRERRSDHSAKPAYYYGLIEGFYPGLPKIELFSRSPREGWSAWGNQS